MRASRALAALLIVALSWAMNGCAMYSETRDKQARDAAESWSKVDLKAQVEVPRKNLQALLTEQLSLEEEIWNTRAQGLARGMAYSWTVKRFGNELTTQIARVYGSASDANEYAERAAEQKRLIDLIAANSLVITAASFAPPSCGNLLEPDQKAKVNARVGAIDANKRALISPIISTLEKDCGLLKKFKEEPSTGELTAATTQLKTEKDALDAEVSKTAAVRDEYTKALNSYEEEAEVLTKTPSNPSLDKLDAALSKLKAVAEKFAGKDDVFTKKFVAEEQLKSLDRFLSTYSDVLAGKGTSKDPSQVAIALAVFPDLIRKADVALQSSKKPMLTHLVIQKNLEQAKLDAAERDIVVRRKLIELWKAQVEALQEQLGAYLQAHSGLSTPAIAALEEKSLREALSPSNNEDEFENKQKLWKSAALYLDAENRLRAEVAKNRYRILALQYEKTLTYAEANINQWRALIEPTVELMGAYGESGLRSSEITAFLNSLTLLWIGAGVN
jgi:hypothetical protein